MTPREALEIVRNGPPYPEVYCYDRRADHAAAQARYAAALRVLMDLVEKTDSSVASPADSR